MRFNPEMADPVDQLHVAITEDGAFRVITANTTRTVRDAIRAQNVEGPDVSTFGELMTATAMYRVTMAPTMRVQGMLKGAHDSGYMIADSHPESWCRGLVKAKGGGSVALDDGALLQMMRTLIRGDLHQGVIGLGADATISQAMMTYFQQSEQIVCQMEVCCALQDGEVKMAGGYIVELLPEAPEDGLAIMTARLEHDFGNFRERFLAWEGCPIRLRDELLYGMGFAQTQEAGVRFGCDCSRVRVLASLGTIGAEDLREMMNAREPVEMSCDYCGSDYVVQPEELRGLLESS